MCAARREGPLEPLHEQAGLVLDAARGGRGKLKRQAAWLQEQPAAVREAVIAVARKRGAVVPDEAANWPCKRLLRACLDRSEAAQVRRNPIARDEAFTCSHCSRDVPPHGRTARDHCPHCLRSLHVDEVPGDRASGCGGVLDPVSMELRGSDMTLFYRCRRCGAERRNRALQDGDPPDDARLLARLSAREAV